jgi:hypothetical protein
MALAAKPGENAMHSTSHSGQGFVSGHEPQAPALGLGGFVRELVAAMPIVILVCAVRSASKGVARRQRLRSVPARTQ